MFDIPTLDHRQDGKLTTLILICELWWIHWLNSILVTHYHHCTSGVWNRLMSCVSLQEFPLLLNHQVVFHTKHFTIQLLGL